MKRTLSFVAALLLIASFVLSACAPAAAPAATAAPAAKAIKVVYIVNGTQGDKSFIDSAVRGIRQAEKEFGMQVKIIEAGNDPAKWQPALVDAAANEVYDILIVGSWQMSDFLMEVAPKYPDKKFFIYDVSVDYTKCDCKNVYSVQYKQNEGSYLAGYYAALMTKVTTLKGINEEPTLGVVAAQPIPVIDDFVVGFKNGAKDAGLDPEKNVIVQYAGGWTDPAKGKEQALAMYQQGADIVFQVAGGTGEGVFQAALEAGKYAIGVDSDQALIEKTTNPDLAAVIITSMMKNVDNSLYRAFKMHVAGTLPYGKVEILGVAEGGVGLAYNEYYDKYTPQEIKDKMKQVQADLLAGKIKVDSVFK